METAWPKNSFPVAAASPPAAEAAITEIDAATADETAKAKALEKKRRERSIIFFLVASVISCLLAGVFGLGVYEAMSTQKLEEYLARAADSSRASSGLDGGYTQRKGIPLRARDGRDKRHLSIVTRRPEP